MTTTLSDRGQTVVPAEIRKAHNLGASSRLEWVDDGMCIRVIPLGNDSIAAARGLFAGRKLTKALLKSRMADRARG